MLYLGVGCWSDADWCLRSGFVPDSRLQVRAFNDQEAAFAFETEMAASVIPAYMPMVEKRKDVPYTEAEREWQVSRWRSVGAGENSGSRRAPPPSLGPLDGDGGVPCRG